jgi:hypothetical protein
MEVLERRFATIGARVRVPESPWLGMPQIDVATDRRGEFFDLRFNARGPVDEVELDIVDARPDTRHLLLLVRDGREKSKFLCGHDERHWFVAAVPESARGVSGVSEAMRALQPDGVRAAVARMRPKDPLRRKNAAYVRQGEWFFLPAPDLVVDANAVRHYEPISRGRGSKPHVVELVYRRGGQLVYVSRRYPSGLDQRAFDALTEDARRRESWIPMTRDAEVYAKGTVRHPDHATIVLRTWHRIEMNTEQRARAMRHVVFLD